MKTADEVAAECEEAARQFLYLAMVLRGKDKLIIKVERPSQ